MSGPGTSSRPRALVAVVLAVAVESALMLGVVAFFAVELVVADAVDPTGAVATAVLAGLVGVGLALCARGLLAGRRWARAPVLTWQLLQAVAVAIPLLGTLAPRTAVVGAVLLALGLVAGGGLFVPSVVAATTEQTQPPVV